MLCIFLFPLLQPYYVTITLRLHFLPILFYIPGPTHCNWHPFCSRTCHQDLRLQFVSSKWVVCEHFLALLVVVRNAPSPSCRQKSLFSLFLTLHSGSRSVFFSCSSSLFFEREKKIEGEAKKSREREKERGTEVDKRNCQRREGEFGARLVWGC